MPLEWRNISRSESVTRIGYNVKTRELQIEFTSGGRYSYADVPKAVADGLLNATSKGSYVATHIVRAGFKYTCLERAPKKDPTHVGNIAFKKRRPRQSI